MNLDDARVPLHSSIHGRGTPLVLLHPIGLDSECWAEVARLLKHEYRVITVDLPGHGRSVSRPGEFTLDEFADDVAALIERKTAGEAVFIVGLSLGGMVAQLVALRHRRYVNGLVLAATASGFAPHIASSFLERAQLAESEGMGSVVPSTLERWFAPTFATNHQATVATVREKLLLARPHVHAATWRAMSRFQTGASLPSLDLPALVIAGELDQSTPPATVRTLASQLRNSEYVEFAATGHMIGLERPAEVARAVSDFIGAAVDEKPRAS